MSVNLNVVLLDINTRGRLQQYLFNVLLWPPASQSTDVKPIKHGNVKSAEIGDKVTLLHQVDLNKVMYMYKLHALLFICCQQIQLLLSLRDIIVHLADYTVCDPSKRLLHTL